MNKMNKMKKIDVYCTLCFKVTDSIDIIHKIYLNMSSPRLFNKKIQRRTRKTKRNLYCILKV